MRSKVIYNTTRYLLGALFVFSGFAKGVNPFGLSLQFDSYFTALGLDFLAPLGPLGAIVLPAGELWLGFLLLFGFAERLTRWAVGAVMLFFTGLTLWIALENPVSDCGCFGELWKISNWETFFKNVVFLAAAVLFWQTTPQSRKRRGGVALSLGLAVLSVGLPLWCWYNLPLVESSPWAVGRDIRMQMHSTYSEETDTELVYRNRATGVEQKFSLADTTWQDDTAWEYVRTESVVRSSGEKGVLADAVMVEPRSERNVARELFTTPGVMVLVVLPDPGALSQEQSDRLGEIVEAWRGRATVVTCLTATPDAQLPYNLSGLLVDRSLLHAMVPNAVGGIVLVQEGVIYRKSAL